MKLLTTNFFYPATITLLTWNQSYCIAYATVYNIDSIHCFFWLEDQLCLKWIKNGSRLEYQIKSVKIIFNRYTNDVIVYHRYNTLDHVYTNDATLVNDISYKVPTFGDHLLVILQLNVRAVTNSASFCKRNWLNYLNAMPFLSDNIFLLHDTHQWDY